jgi:ABC-type lipoprotein export system ATPase subunit
LIPFLSARENVELAVAFSSRRSRRDARARALELLERFEVAHRAGHRPRHLSGGEAQRVALAVSMANEPALLLADEVVAQLDSDTAARVVDAVLTADFAVLFVSHEVALADLVERRFVLVDSELVVR